MIRYYQGDSESIAQLFTAAIHRSGRHHYTPEQLHAWAPLKIDLAYWHHRCELKRPFIYVHNSHTLGFIELDPDGHIDCHYVHPDHQRRGIGQALLRYAENVAHSMRIPRLFVEASKMARGLYERNGFSLLRSNSAVVRDVHLENYIMEKQLK